MAGTDRRGYRYQSLDPLAERDWPAMPHAFTVLAARLCGGGVCRICS
jgi:alkylated DNA repair dioxygenase AlkB